MSLQRGVLGATLRESYDDILDDSIVSSNHSMVTIELIPSHTWSMIELYLVMVINGYCYQAFEQDDNANVLNISTDNSKDTSKCHFKR